MWRLERRTRVYRQRIGGYANSMSQTAISASPRVINVVVPIYEGVTLLDIAGPTEALNHVGEINSALSYHLYYLCCGETDWVTSSTGLPIKGVRLGELPTQIHTLLVPGAPAVALRAAIFANPFMATLRRLAARAQRLASVCTGAFLLGELGELDGRRVTTHWSGLAELAERYPAARVAKNHLFETDGRLWTSACLLYTSPSPRDQRGSRMPSSA